MIQIEGGRKADGEIRIQGSKNGVLPMIAATLLVRGQTVLKNCPHIEDVTAMAAILGKIGASTWWQEDCLVIDTSKECKCSMEQDEVGKVRASILFLGSMLGRCGSADILFPGGCSIGERPIDLHLNGFEKMGIKVEMEKERIHCNAFNIEETVDILLAFPSVGATENMLLYAVKRSGITRIRQGAREPEILQLCQFLREMGAKIEEGTEGEYVVYGGKPLRAVEYEVESDRIAFATYGCMIAGTKGRGKLLYHKGDFQVEKKYLQQIGCTLREEKDGTTVYGPTGIRPISYLRTGPYPEFPTDCQSIFLALLSRAFGKSIVEECVFENRFLVVRELRKMGADIEVAGQRAYVHGVIRLHGDTVEAADLRSGAALMLAGTMAEGITKIQKSERILRGYECPIDLMNKLGLCASESLGG